jgi:galactokinase
MAVDVEHLAAEFERIYGRPPALISEAPGRVNLIGEHTDYNEGFVLPLAINRTVAIAASERTDNLLRAYSADYGQSDEFPVDRVRRFAGNRGWRDYVRGVAWALQDSQIVLHGADMVVSGDVPQGAGLSSSAALEVAVAGALTSLSEVDIDRRKLALLCQKAENMFVGVQCGIMDQLTSALGKTGHAILIDCRSLETRSVPLPPDYAIAIVDSKLRRQLADTGYNERRKECAEAALRLGIDALRDADVAMLTASRESLGDVLYRRARHVVTENERVLEMVNPLSCGAVEDAGWLMFQSHESLRDDFEVSTPELDVLVEAARGIPDVAGARLTGAGFGGATVNLVRRHAVAQLETAVSEAGLEQTPEVVVCEASGGLRVSHV